MTPAPYFLLALLLAQSGAGPQKSESLLRQGLIELQQNRLPTARENLEAASRLDSKNPIIWGALAQTYWKLKDQPSALRAAQSAETLGAGNGIVAHVLTIFYGEAGDIKRAAQFERQYARSPQAGPDAAGSAASLSLDAGEPLEALAFARQAVDKAPTAHNRNLLGRIQMIAGDKADGLANLSEAWKADRTNEQYCFDYAQALLNRADFSGAAEVIGQGLAAHPGNAQLQLALGVSHYGQRRFEEAIGSFLKTIALDPSVEQPYIFLGRMLDHAGPRIADIIKYYKAWSIKEPDNFQTSLLLAKAFSAADGAPPEIEKLLRRSIRLNADYWESHYELGLVLVKQRNFAQAAAELERSAVLNPKEALPHYHLARVYDRLGDAEKAAAERKRHEQLSAAK